MREKLLQDQMRKGFEEKARKNRKDLDESSGKRKGIRNKGYRVNQ